MKRSIWILAFALLNAPLFAQNSCSAGTAYNASFENVGAACTPVTGAIGNYIVALNQTATIGTQTICDTSSTCGAGLVTIHVYIVPITTGLTLSSVTPSITYTDEGGTKTVALGSALSLLTTNPGSYTVNFYHAANTSVTVTTVFIAGTGTPSYDYRSRLVLLGAG